MKRYSICNNSGVVLVTAKKNMNYILIGGVAAALTLIDMFNFQKTNTYNFNMITVNILCITAYLMYLFLVHIGVKLLRKITFISKIEINTDNIKLHSGMLKLTLDIENLIVDDNLSEAYKKKVTNKFNTNEPCMLILEKDNKRIGLIVDKSELSKLN